jgi:O-methyltransferase involved in polyketide biosynthesis
MNTREIVTLTKEQETLLIPLYSKAQENPILQDPKARQILEGIQYDFSRLKIPEKTTIMLLMRAKQLDAYTQAFIDAHPDAVILHLGCGLDSRCQRVQRGSSLWYDLDLPDAIELRRKFYPETNSYHLISSSVTDLTWVDQVQAQGRPVFIVAEGLMMYLSEQQVKDLILRLNERFPGSHLVFDAFSKLTARKAGGIRSLQETQATVQWGTDDPHEIETWVPGTLLKEQWFFSMSPDLGKLSGLYRLMFRMTGGMKVAREAHRILYYTFGKIH